LFQPYHRGQHMTTTMVMVRVRATRTTRALSGTCA
jgi:hypothetical protein